VRRLNIVIATPAARATRKGNRVTALRWAGHLRALRHRVRVVEAWDGQPCDLLVALHATKSLPSVERYRARHPDAPLVVGLAGTDLYQELRSSPQAQRALELATRLTVLQPLGIAALPLHVRHKTRPIIQSARAVRPVPAPPGVFQICLLAHLREVKDPLLGAAAVRLLPATSRVRLVHLGGPLDPGSSERALLETRTNARYVWLGARPRREALGVLGGSRLLIVTSRLEGGSNAVSEAIAAGVPVLSTRVDGSVGVLGPGYPGFYPVGDAAALARAIARTEEDEKFLGALLRGVDRVRPLVDPLREREAWRALVAELGLT
jgi:putative glycosyltransferase (TIGR04348 family)